MSNSDARLAVLSDVHGNLPALEAVLADVAEQGVERILVAGDLTGGPQQNETTQLLLAQNCWMIRGNSDAYSLQLDDGTASDAQRTSRQWAVARWAYHHLDQETLALIRSLPEQGVFALPGRAAIRVVHGSPAAISELIFPLRDPPTLERALAQTVEPVLVCGHTHLPWVHRQNGRLALNPGAVCGTLDGDPSARYALFTWEGEQWQVTHRAVAYDLSRIRAAFRESGLLEEGGPLARAHLLSIETGHNVGWDLVSYAYQLAEALGLPTQDGVPDGLWEQASAAFDWNRAMRGEPQDAPAPRSPHQRPGDE